MNFDLGQFLKDKVKDQIGDSQLIGLEFLSMHNKFHQCTTNNKDAIAEKWFCADLALWHFPAKIEPINLYVPRNHSAKFEQNPTMDTQDFTLKYQGQVGEIVFLQ